MGRHDGVTVNLCWLLGKLMQQADLMKLRINAYQMVTTRTHSGVFHCLLDWRGQLVAKALDPLVGLGGSLALV